MKHKMKKITIMIIACGLIACAGLKSKSDYGEKKVGMDRAEYLVNKYNPKIVQSSGWRTISVPSKTEPGMEFLVGVHDKKGMVAVAVMIEDQLTLVTVVYVKESGTYVFEFSFGNQFGQEFPTKNVGEDLVKKFFESLDADGDLSKIAPFIPIPKKGIGTKDVYTIV